MKKCKNKLVINSSTWNKDSNELFDYECSDLIKLRLKTCFEGCLIRTNDEIKYINSQQSFIKNSRTRLLVGLECNKNHFYVKKPTPEENSETPWIVCKFLKNNLENTGYKLSVGDIIKLGRVKLKIKEIKLDQNENSVDNNHTKHFATKINEKSFNDNKDRVSNINNEINPQNKNTNLNLFASHSNSQKNLLNNHLKKSKAICRICYCDDIEVDSPLISPCSCSGSMKFIHFSCLQTWLKSKIVVKSTVTDHCSSYSLKQIECELCKVVFPDFVKYKGKLYDTKEFVKPAYKTFITLESIQNDKNSNKILFYVNIESKQNIRIGRGHDSDVRISDISVSRFHALIRKAKDDCLYLEDNISKFGTLVLLQNPKINILTTSLPLQIGRSLLTFNIKKPWGFFRCLSSKKSEENVDYQIYNSESINIENDVIVKVQDDNYELTDYSIDNKKRLDCDAKSEKNSIILQIGPNNEQVNIEELKEDEINLANQSEEIKKEEPKPVNLCFSEDMNIAEEHEMEKSQVTIQNYKFFQKKNANENNNLAISNNINVEIENKNEIFEENVINQ